MPMYSTSDAPPQAPAQVVEAPLTPQEKERQVIEQENQVFRDALAKGAITPEQYNTAMTYQNSRLSDNVVSATSPTPQTVGYLDSMRFYSGIGYSQYGGLYQAPTIPEGYRVESVREVSNNGERSLSFSLIEDRPAPPPSAPSIVPTNFWTTGSGNPSRQEAVDQALAQVPTGATNVQLFERPFVGPPAPSRSSADYPSAIVVSYDVPTPPKAATPAPEGPKSLSQTVYEMGAKMSNVPVGGNPITSAIRGALGMDPNPNPLAGGAGVIASFENVAYSAPRQLVAITYEMGGQIIGKPTEGKIASTVANIALDRVIPKPPATVSSGVASYVFGQGADTFNAAVKDPSYGAGTVVGDILLSIVVSKGINKITGGTLGGQMRESMSQTQERLRETRFGQNFQDKLNMDYRVAFELGDEYRPSFTDKVVSKVTGITAKEPVKGEVGLPNVATANPSKYIEYAGVKEVESTSVITAAGKNGKIVDVFEVSGPVEVPVTFKKEMADLTTVSAKKQGGLDAFDFMDAPNSYGFGRSFDPVEKAAQVAKPIKNVYWFDSSAGKLVSTSVLNPVGQNRLSWTKPADLREAEQAAIMENPKAAWIGGFDKTPYKQGFDSRLAFQKSNLPSLQQLIPVESKAATVAPRVTNTDFYRRVPFRPITGGTTAASILAGAAVVTVSKANYSTIGKTATGQGSASAKVESVNAQSLVSLPWELLSRQQRRELSNQGQDQDSGVAVASYPSSGLSHPPRLDLGLDSGLSAIGVQGNDVGNRGATESPIVFQPPTQTSLTTPVLEIGNIGDNKLDLRSPTIPIVGSDPVEIITPKESSKPITGPNLAADLVQITGASAITHTTHAGFNPFPNVPNVSVGGLNLPRGSFDFHLGGGGKSPFMRKGGYGRQPRKYPIVTGAQFLEGLLSKSSKKSSKKASGKTRKGKK